MTIEVDRRLPCWPDFADGWHLLGRLLEPKPEALPCLRHAKALGAEAVEGG